MHLPSLACIRAHGRMPHKADEITRPAEEAGRPLSLVGRHTMLHAGPRFYSTSPYTYLPTLGIPANHNTLNILLAYSVVTGCISVNPVFLFLLFHLEDFYLSAHVFACM